MTNKDTITIEWCTDDVLEECDWLTKDQARDVLAMCLKKHDRTIGITWEVIEIIACEMYPKHSTKQI
tara:strand:- start:36 stop:236 length:201 start_codon:yes stop_codon:yes gene_type:complete